MSTLSEFKTMKGGPVNKALIRFNFWLPEAFPVSLVDQATSLR